MELSCFFCQTMLSDFLEEILPSGKQQEIRSHLEECKSCDGLLNDIKKGIALMEKTPFVKVPQELALKLSDAPMSHPLKIFQRPRLTRKMGSAALGLAVLVGLFWVFQNREAIPFLNPNSKGNFARYYPLLQGASEILEEQSSLISKREPFNGSLWEEGGLSPEDFEKTFQGTKGTAPKGK